MMLSVLLGFFMFVGVLIAAFGLVLPGLTSRRSLRQQVLTHLAHPLPTPLVDTERPIALRRMDSSWWNDVLAEITPHAGATEARRLSLIRLGLVLSVLGVGLIAFTLSGSWVGLLLGTAGPFLGWLFYLRLTRAKRMLKIEESVPEAMDMIVRALKVGQPIPVALQSASKDLQGPLAAEFLNTAEKISYGQGAAEALRDMAERCENQNLRFLAAAVSLQSTAGGNLADVLERLAEVARSRLQMRRKIAAITAESKWSGRFLSAFPLIATAGLLIVNPNFYDGVSDQPFFLPLMMGVGALLALNVIFMRWLLKVD